uniref:Regulator of G-protein signaling 12-like n=1 Tax=Sinocyclocheilus rhinocerous TaxID=307959 RepID=A0A673I0B7_9TELE
LALLAYKSQHFCCIQIKQLKNLILNHLNCDTYSLPYPERSGLEHHDCGSVSSLESNGSLPSVTNHCRFSERRVASWAVSFERLLQDPVGVRYFSEFLKKEFSEENILFWQACECFKRTERKKKHHKKIYNRFLSSKATMPVNIDSQAQLADDVLTAPQPNMFKQPQLQIFNLMKMDCYARFLKSTLYQECMLAEVEGRPLPDPCPIPCSPAPSKHSFTSDRSTFSTPKKVLISLQQQYLSRKESQGSLSSGASQELNTSSSGGKNEVRRLGVTLGSLKVTCTVMLPNGSGCSIPLRQGASIRQVLLELCQKQHINLAAVDLFLTGGEKVERETLHSFYITINKSTLFAIFRLDLVPINRSVGLKAKPTKPVTEVLRPVVAKYGLHLGDLVARIVMFTFYILFTYSLNHSSFVEFFELLSRAQSSRVDDQRGLLRKEDLVLPDFLRVDPDPESHCAA